MVCALRKLGFRHVSDPVAKHKVAILSRNCPEWLICDMAAMCAGGAGTGVYVSDTADKVEYVIGNSGARVLFVDGMPQLEKVMSFLDRTPEEFRVRSSVERFIASFFALSSISLTRHSSVQVVVFFPSEELPNHPKVMSYRDFLDSVHGSV